MTWSLNTMQPELTDIQYFQWSELLEERVGLHLNQHNRTFLQTQVSRRMKELGQTDYTQYFQELKNGVSGLMEWSILLERLVIQETRFFRHRPSFEFVSRFLRERLVKRKNNFDAWSVGCSTGEEPCSLAMTIDEGFKNAQLTPYFGILATDINRSALGKARIGIYLKKKLETMDERYRDNYFQSLNNEQMQVSPMIKERICYHNANVLDIDKMPDMEMDVIFCQDLLSNFRAELRHKVLDAFVDRLKPCGALILSQGDSDGWYPKNALPMPTNVVTAYIKS